MWKMAPLTMPLCLLMVKIQILLRVEVTPSHLTIQMLLNRQQE